MSPFSLGVPETYDFKSILVISAFMGLIIGLLAGSVMVFVNYKLFQKKSFRFALLATAISYVVLYFIIAFFVNIALTWNRLGDSASITKVTTISINNLTAIYTLPYFVLWGAITLLTIFFLQVNDKFGPGVLRKFLAGKYFQPRGEQRIFMFLDIKSSTSIAEKIGHTKYFKLLKDFFADITSPIIESRGEIYQYVGDEVVICWSLKNGIKDANCIKCYFNIKNKIDELAPNYKKRYGLVPEFKAGLHYGNVTAGEIGSIKRDIIYSGDVLNTTSRIQEQCKSYDVNFLLSRRTFDLLENKDQFELIPLGNIELRGKQDKINLNTVRLIS
ncbi:MAG: adenylate/guanylate cyclase domain-containing protein [Ignavibacterium sp.]|nr:MAG: adenylate/guanylate cyclase domain-containing protein [Ignavibacterium sp.]